MEWRFIPASVFVAWALAQACAAQSAADGSASGGTSTISFSLTNTPAAPLAARGSAELQTSSLSVTNSPTLSLSTQGLLPGTYNIYAERRSDGVFVFLGAVTVRDPAASPDAEAGDSKNSRSSTHSTDGLATQTAMPLPPGLAIADIRGVRVSNVGNTVLLAGVVPPGNHPESEAAR